MVSFTVLSRDRACQLDLLLRSTRLLAPDVGLTVLWTATTAEFRRGYDLARERFTEVQFHEQSDFHTDVQTLAPAAGVHGWLSDDDVFVRALARDDPVVEAFIGWPQTLALSLRLHPGIVESAGLGRLLPATRARRLPSGGIEVRWAGNPNLEWANPFSLDGHLFHAETLSTLLAGAFVDPATMRAEQERLLAWFAGMRPRILAWEEPRVVCVPLHAAARGTSADPALVIALNERYLAGRQIRLDPFVGRTWLATRAARPFELELRRAS